MTYFLILIGALLRVVPHAANFAPIGALALFGGVYLSKKQALIIPLAAMIVSDFFIGFDSLHSRLTIYSVFLMIGLIGLLIRNHKNIFTVEGGAITGSILFFLITNLPFVHTPSLYPQTLDGTIQSYINGLPFFRNTLLSDMLYTAVFFGAYEVAVAYKNNRNFLKLEKVESLKSKV